MLQHCVVTPRSLVRKTSTFVRGNVQVRTTRVRIPVAFNNLYFARSNCLDYYSRVLVGYNMTWSVGQTRHTRPGRSYLYTAIHFPTI